jgi:tetratricopeptide (TPR) repeat protein
MSGIILITIIATAIFVSVTQTERELTPLSQKFGDRLQKLWLIAQAGIKDQKYLRAEKALLTILKLDKMNAAAYNRLGILYSRQKEYKDAIECFEIASSIEASASSLHNLGLIYYETENYEKAVNAFESALNLEDNLAARHIAYAKVQEKLGNYDIVIASLEKAISLEPNPQTYKLLATVLETIGDKDRASKINNKIDKLIMPAGRPNRVKRPQKVVY